MAHPSLELDTAYTIDPTGCKYRVAAMKIEIKLKKKTQVQWPALEVRLSPRSPGILCLVRIGLVGECVNE